MGPFEVVLEGLDSAEVTVSESPIATVLTSLVEVFGPLRGRLPAALQRQIRTLSRQVDLAALEPVFNRASVPLPSALMPTTVGRASFAEEVERLRGDHQEVADQFAVSLPDEPPVPFRPWLSNPAKALDRYLRALCSYHDVVTTAVHPRLAERLRREADLLRRAAETDRHRYLLTRLPGYARTETASVRVKVRDLRGPARGCSARGAGPTASSGRPGWRTASGPPLGASPYSGSIPTARRTWSCPSSITCRNSARLSRPSDLIPPASQSISSAWFLVKTAGAHWRAAVVAVFAGRASTSSPVMNSTVQPIMSSAARPGRRSPPGR